MKPQIQSSLVAALLCAVVTSDLRAQVPPIITYQGRVQVNGIGPPGDGQFKFALVDPGVNTARPATATATVTLGFVTAIAVTDGGSGYTTAPAVTITGATGSGATATASVSAGAVNSITVNSAGSGYPAVITVTIAPPPPAMVYQTYWSNDGTSVGGSQPSAAVTLPVRDGLFAVGLGDARLPNMATLGTDVLTHPGVHLRIWFNDGVQGFARLSPDQPLTSAPYALLADRVAAGGVSSGALADGAVTTAKLANGAVTSAKLANSAVGNAQLGTISTAGKVANSATTATSANTPNAIVARDASGNFSAGAITASAITGSGAGLTGLNASQLSVGTVPDARLSANVSLLGPSIEVGELADNSVGSRQLQDIISLGATNREGRLDVYNAAGEFGSLSTVSIRLDAASHSIRLYSGATETATLSGFPSSRLDLDQADGDPAVSLTGNVGGRGRLQVFNASGNASVVIDGQAATGEARVGIGTASPNSPLEVAGTVHSTSGGFKFPDGSVQASADDRHALDSEGGALQDIVSADAAGGVTIGREVEYGTPAIDQHNETGGNFRSAEGSYQSFTAGVSGKLTAIRMRMRNDATIGMPLNFYVYRGAGTSGQLLGSFSVTVPPRFLGEFPFNVGIGIEAGSSYTWSIQLGSIVVLEYGLSNPYPGGASSQPGGDFIFNTWVAPPRFAGNPAMYVTGNGDVCIGATDPYSKLDVRGRTRTEVLEITGGSDLSEQFEINGPAAATEAGMLVSIDPNHPGQLVLSRSAYDRSVAGVISGAGGIKPGMLMGQAGSLAGGKYPIALTGRVYCLVDADHGAVQPGDLITTSDTPGHGMKVTDYPKAQGAIIGKAMTRLAQGKGLVLVLITLQ